MEKPNRTKSQEISQEELDALDAIDAVEYCDGYNSNDLQQYLNF